MKINWHDRGVGMTLSIFLFVLGMAFSSVIGDIYYNGSLILWRNIGSPPGGAEQFVYAEDMLKDLRFIVRSKSSPPKYYKRNIEKGGVWEEVVEPTEDWIRNQNNLCNTIPTGLNQLPGVYVDCYMENVGLPLDIIVMYVVILNDGSVWVYYWATGIIDSFAISFCPVALFLVIGWVFILIKRKKIKAEPSTL